MPGQSFERRTPHLHLDHHGIVGKTTNSLKSLSQAFFTNPNKKLASIVCLILGIHPHKLISLSLFIGAPKEKKNASIGSHLPHLEHQESMRATTKQIKTCKFLLNTCLARSTHLDNQKTHQTLIIEEGNEQVIDCFQGVTTQ